MTTELMTLLISVGAITLAEMGDKTQLLAMAFATRFNAWKVMAGVFLATILNHALAVAVGTFLTKNHTLDIWIQTLAALSFILFGLWTLHGDKLEGEQNRVSRFGAVMTVAIAFFFAEMGDKTQLTTLALAAKYPATPVIVLLGTTTGMLIADAVGIIFGVLMCKRIPERKVKLISAAIFILFGFLASWEVATVDFGFGFGVTAALMTFMAAATGIAVRWLLTHEDHTTGYEGLTELEACCPMGPEDEKLSEN